QRLRRGALRRDGRRGRDARMRAVRRDEVRQRLEVSKGEAELGPVRVRLEDRILRREEELPAHFVQRRNAFAAAARDVDRGQVEREADQRVPYRGGDELVELVADLQRETPNDAPGRRRRGQWSGGSAVVVLLRSEEGVEQPDIVRRPVGVDASQ